jgi:hypothetical protein
VIFCLVLNAVGVSFFQRQQFFWDPRSWVWKPSQCVLVSCGWKPTLWSTTNRAVFLDKGPSWMSITILMSFL